MKKPAAKRPAPAKVDTINPTQSDQSSGPIARVESHQWAGPLPPPSILSQYSDVVPNGAARIFEAWEGETKHRHKLEERDLNWSIVEGFVGKGLAGLFIAGVLGMTYYTASIDQPWLAGIFGTIGIASVVGAFVQTNRPRK